MASQTSLLTTSHTDLITSLSFNLYGTKLVTSSLDHSIRITELTTSTNLWDKNLIQFKASETSLVKVVWSHPSFGNILASASIDGIIKIWLEKDAIATTTTMDAKGTAGKKWFNTASLTDARGSMRDLEFCPVEFGLKLAAISSDSHLRLWECLDPIGLSEWSLIEDIDLNHLPYNPSSSSTLLSSGISSQTIPGISQSGFETNASTSLGSNSGSPSKFGHPEAGVTHARGTIESDGGWSLAWCKEAWWGERLAVSSGTTGIIRVRSLLSQSLLITPRFVYISGASLHALTRFVPLSYSIYPTTPLGPITLISSHPRLILPLSLPSHLSPGHHLQVVHSSCLPQGQEMAKREFTRFTLHHYPLLRLLVNSSSTRRWTVEGGIMDKMKKKKMGNGAPRWIANWNKKSSAKGIIMDRWAK